MGCLVQIVLIQIIDGGHIREFADRAANISLTRYMKAREQCLVSAKSPLCSCVVTGKFGHCCRFCPHGHSAGCLRRQERRSRVGDTVTVCSSGACLRLVEPPHRHCRMSDTLIAARNERKPWLHRQKLERGQAVAETRQATPSLDLPSPWRRWTEEKGCVYIYIYISSDGSRPLQHAIVRVVVKKRGNFARAGSCKRNGMMVKGGSMVRLQISLAGFKYLDRAVLWVAALLSSSRVFSLIRAVSWVAAVLL